MVTLSEINGCFGRFGDDIVGGGKGGWEDLLERGRGWVFFPELDVGNKNNVLEFGSKNRNMDGCWINMVVLSEIRGDVGKTVVTVGKIGHCRQIVVTFGNKGSLSRKKCGQNPGIPDSVAINKISTRMRIWDLYLLNMAKYDRYLG